MTSEQIDQYVRGKFSDVSFHASDGRACFVIAGQSCDVGDVDVPWTRDAVDEWLSRFGYKP
jgi:hypothetical protein